MKPLMFQADCWIKRFIREGATYQQALAEITPNLWKSPDNLRAYQTAKLKETLALAYRHIPYYRQLFEQLHLHPSDIQTLEDLSKLPLMDKQTIRDHGLTLVNPKTPQWMRYEKQTSGSTGTPCNLVRDFHSASFENAFLSRHRKWAGYQEERKVNFRISGIIPLRQTAPPYWRFNMPDNELIMSYQHLSLKTSPLFIQAILDYQPEVCLAYPSTVALLAELFEANKTTYRFKRIFTSSEMLNDDMRARIEDVFGCPVSDWYGQAERVAAIGQCAQGTYHIMEDYGITELIPAEGGYEVVGTSLNNPSMPLIRYKTGDIVIPGNEHCSCGSAFRTIAHIVGRTPCHILSPEGVQFVHLNHIPRGVAHVVETQFYQEQADAVEVRVVVSEGFCQADADQLIQNVHNLVSPRLAVTVRPVDVIERGPNGKFISAICLASAPMTTV